MEFPVHLYRELFLGINEKILISVKKGDTITHIFEIQMCFCGGH